MDFKHNEEYITFELQNVRSKIKFKIFNDRYEAVIFVDFSIGKELLFCIIKQISYSHFSINMPRFEKLI